MKTNIATDSSQSQRLLRCGVSADTADMIGIEPNYGYECELWSSMQGQDTRGYFPAWSLNALLGLLPKEIKVDESPHDEVQRYGLLIYPFMGGWQAEYQYCEDDECHCLKCVYGTDLLEACVQLIEWLMENNYKLNEQ